MSPHSSWLLVSEIIPRLASTIPKAVPRVGCEDWEELIQDGTALAAQILVSAENKGKSPTAGNIAYYTLRSLQSGRRSTGYSNAEVLGAGTRLHRRSSVCSLDEPFDSESDAECFTLADLISDPSDDPAQATTRKLDWESFLETLDHESRRLIEWLAEGGSLVVLAGQRKISPATATRRKQELAEAALEFFGADVCAVAANEPAWRNNLHAMQERLACRQARLCH